MATKVRVFNDNSWPLEEIFKGEDIRIEAKDYWRDKKGMVKEMDIFEANDFRGNYHPRPFDGSGKMIEDPRYYKMVKMEPVDGELYPTQPVKVTSFPCMAAGCKHVSPSIEELEAHTNVQHPNADRLIMPDEDAAISRKKSKAQATA